MLFVFRCHKTMTYCMKPACCGRVVASRRKDRALADEMVAAAGDDHGW